jgi:hypothetical protein
MQSGAVNNERLATGCFHSHRSGYPRNPARANSDLNSLIFIPSVTSVWHVIEAITLRHP